MVLIVFFNERGSVFGGNLLPQKYSPPQRSLDAYGMRFAGARHGHHKTAYKLNSLGLPEKVMLYSKQLEIPSDISVEIIDNEHIYDEEYGNVNMAYDESGTRIWERTYTRGGYQGSNVTIPGIGIYRKETLAGDFKLTHLDLVGGGFRKGLAEEAIYPMVDAQGNVRAYASASGIKSAYDYRPFGRVEELEENAVADERRWQGKEFDGEHGKYYFGARYFDPFFGMWMSPDPAGQFANPYSYGGDPINFIDPTGLFALDLAFVSIGWDSNKGWNFGFSTPFYSYTWNQNGSKTFTAGIDASINWGFFNFGGDIGYSYNTYSGHSVSTGGHICLGAEGNCAGIEAGGSLYWDPYGNYLGATAYGGAFAELTLGDYNAKVNAGYEIGLMGMEGRGLYAGANVGKDGASLYASWAENGGWNYGGGYKKQLLGINYDENSSSLLTLQLFELGNITLIGQLKADQFYLDNMKGMNDFIDDGGDDTFVLAGHARIVNGIPTGEILINDKWYNAEALVELLPDIGYKPGQDIRLISCRYSGVLGAFFGIGPWLKSNGTWNVFQNGKLIGVTKDE